MDDQDTTLLAGDAPEADEAERKMELDVEIEDAGPCKKHIRITVPRDEIDRIYQEAVESLVDTAEVPGFRAGHVPSKLIERRFKKELSGQVKQDVLMQSLERLEDYDTLEPISEPDIDVEGIELPEEGDFEYEFDIEVRPEFDLPDYKGLKIERPVREVTDEHVAAAVQEYLEQYGELEPIEGAAQRDDFVTVRAEFGHNDNVIRRIPEISVRVRPTLSFRDGEIEGFAELMEGATDGDVRETEFQISMEAPDIEMRGETIRARFEVLDVKRLRVPEMSESFLERIEIESEEALRDAIRSSLERQITYQQRQAVRSQVLEQITASADWELPEDLLRKQADNALRREMLEMQQAGFTTQQIRARQNELRSRMLSTTEKNLKQHFVLDRIADTEELEVDVEEINMEIALMAAQSGENPRRVRARLQKSGVIENLQAQIRERKAVDVILDHADFTDVTMDAPHDPDVEAVDRAICEEDVEEEEAPAEA